MQFAGAMQDIDSDFWETLTVSNSATPLVKQAGLLAETVVAPEPLGDQLGVFPQVNIPPSFRASLFDPLETKRLSPISKEEGHSGTEQSYALLDAAKATNLVDRLNASGLEFRCLFKGQAEQELSEVAPYLVSLREDDNLTRTLFTGPKGCHGLWHSEPGIFLRSPLKLETLWQHLRRFTRVQNSSGKWYYFRYWEPAVARSYFSDLAERPETVAQWFCRRAHQALSAVIVPWSTPEGIGLDIFRPAQGLVQPNQIDAPFRLEPQDFALLQRSRLNADVDEIVARVEIDFAELIRPEDKEQYPQTSRRCLSRMMEFGFRQKSNLLLLLVWELAYGPDFSTIDSEGRLKAILLAPGGETDRMQVLRDQITELA